MGRGRAKAKQAKIARELKYFSPQTDLTALQHELGNQTRHAHDEPGVINPYNNANSDDDPAN
jgi:hypothetical protein